MKNIGGFEELGSLKLNVVDASRVVIGVLEHSPDKVALALGSGEQDLFVLLECEPARARQIAASLLNKADSVEGIA